MENGAGYQMIPTPTEEERNIPRIALWNDQLTLSYSSPKPLNTYRHQEDRGNRELFPGDATGISAFTSFRISPRLLITTLSKPPDPKIISRRIRVVLLQPAKSRILFTTMIQTLLASSHWVQRRDNRKARNRNVVRSRYSSGAGILGTSSPHARGIAMAFDTDRGVDGFIRNTTIQTSQLDREPNVDCLVFGQLGRSQKRSYRITPLQRQTEEDDNSQSSGVRPFPAQNGPDKRRTDGGENLSKRSTDV